MEESGGPRENQECFVQYFKNDGLSSSKLLYVHLYMSLAIQVPGLEQPQKCGRVQPIKGVKDGTMLLINICSKFICLYCIFFFLK